jgi:hypothetical protein
VPKSKGCHHPRERRRTGKAAPDASQREHHAVAYDIASSSRRGAPSAAANADLAPALRHGVGDHAVDADDASSSARAAAMTSMTSANDVAASERL